MLFGPLKAGWRGHLAISAQKLSLSLVNRPLKVNNRVRFGGPSGTLFGIFETSGLSALNFRVDGFEFVSSVVDFHSPVDSSLRVIHVR